MKNIYEIRVIGVSEEDIFSFFYNRVDKDHSASKFFVSFHKYYDHPTPEDRRFSVRVYGWGIYDKGNLFIGQIKTTKIGFSIILTFSVENNKDIRPVLEYIETIKGELIFSGIKILGCRNLVESSGGLEHIEEIYLPTKKATQRKWKEAYKSIIDYQEDMANGIYTDIIVPSLEDIRDYLKQNNQLNYSTKTISRIIKAGKSGLLN